MSRLKNIFPDLTRSIVFSYSQVFFSNDISFAVILMIVTFFNLHAGLSGLLAVLTANIAACLIGLNRQNIKSGYYGFNALLVGLGIGVYYRFSPEFFVVLFFASLLTLMLTVTMEGVIGKYGLPYLTIPFLIALWVVQLATRQYSQLALSESGLFTVNELQQWGGTAVVRLYDWFSALKLPGSLIIFFKSLGAIYFQYSLLGGILIAVGLLIYSRIAFLLSLLGFFSAYLYYHFIGANINELSYSYIGFNYILTAIAVGGFFIISSRYSFLWVLLLTPIISVLITSSSAVMNLLQLSIYSLAFNIIVLVFLYVLKFRERFLNKPEVVRVQGFSPERNLYLQINNKERFGNSLYLTFSLPFWGEWTVSQGHDGSYTHREQWRHAWDFVIRDDQGLTFKNDGSVSDDFYSYNKPVIAPYHGWVEETVNTIDDNAPGEVNLTHNWGNTVIIKHSDQLYSKLSHLKKGSIRIKKGDYVRKGDLLAYCGNSGRSPEPHIHFQIQNTPFIGSRTMQYPFGHYIVRSKGTYHLRSFSIPAENETVLNIEKTPAIYEAFHFIPGQTLHFDALDQESGVKRLVTLEVQNDLYNNTFIYCPLTKAKAYFINDGSLHYFTGYEGKKNTLLFYFYLGAYKVLAGFYKGMTYTDRYPLSIVRNKPLKIMQDFVAPFTTFIHAVYTLTYEEGTTDLTSGSYRITTMASIRIGKFILRKIDFEFFLTQNKIDKFMITEGTKKIIISCAGE
jgi:urea transporter/murein DD-endopeptidase MepM/ murein hydrolase activator NlpD